MDTTALTPDPVEMVRHLDPDAIRARLAEMERERRALLVLLRAAGRVRPDRARPATPAGKGVVRG